MKYEERRDPIGEKQELMASPLQKKYKVML